MLVDIYKDFLSGAATPIPILNTNQKETDEVIQAQREGRPWSRFGYTVTDAEQVSIGGRFIRFSGEISIEIFVKIGTGESGARDIAERFESLFKDKAINYRLGVGRFSSVGEGQGWYRFDFAMSYTVDVDG